jgi:transcriptional regulator with XRE-family HTH domain
MARRAKTDPPPSLLAAMRERAGLTQVELSERAGLDRGDLSKYESGKRRLTKDMAMRIAAHLPGTHWLDIYEDPDVPADVWRIMRKYRLLDARAKTRVEQLADDFLERPKDDQ